MSVVPQYFFSRWLEGRAHEMVLVASSRRTDLENIEVVEAPL